MNSSDRPKSFNSVRRWWCVIACATAIVTVLTFLANRAWTFRAVTGAPELAG